MTQRGVDHVGRDAVGAIRGAQRIDVFGEGSSAR
jgi:hypothetical protein